MPCVAFLLRKSLIITIGSSASFILLYRYGHRYSTTAAILDFKTVINYSYQKVQVQQDLFMAYSSYLMRLGGFVLARVC
jgi:hypothetical protein